MTEDEERQYNARADMAAAWRAVYDTMLAHNPGCLRNAPNARAGVLAEIERLYAAVSRA